MSAGSIIDQGESAPPAGRGGFLGRAAWWVLALVVAQRLAILVFYRVDLAAFIAEQGDFLIYHFLPVEVLRARPGDALLYLQQSPPLPSLLLTLICRVFRWPDQVSWVLIGLNGLLDAIAAGLLADLVARVWRRPWWGFALGLVFGLGPDLVILDYNVRGQSFYENATMVLVLLACRLIWRLLTTADLAPAVWLGAAAAAAALTRASYSFFSIALLLMLFFLPIAGRRRRLAAFALAALLLQGAWTAKNWWVFGVPRWSTSTWGGANLAAGLVNMGYGPELQRVILDHADDYPPFLVGLVREKVDFGFFYPAPEATLPTEVVAADRALDAALLGRNRFQNRVAQRIAFDHLAGAWRRLMLERPEIALRKLKWGYKLYWFPTRYHTGQFFHLSPLESEWGLSPALSPLPTIAALGQGIAPETVWLLRATRPELVRRSIELPTLDLLNIAAWQLNLLLVHLVALPAVLVLFGRRVWRQEAWTPAEAFHLALAGVFVYAAVVHNLVEFGENMRFRLNVEPVIWLLSYSGAQLAVRAWAGRRQVLPGAGVARLETVGEEEVGGQAVVADQGEVLVGGVALAGDAVGGQVGGGDLDDHGARDTGR